MRVRELSGRSGTSVASIKFYLREGLLPAGTTTGRNQADYGEDHVRRLRLIRALLDVGGLSIAAARQVLTAVDTPDVGQDLLSVAHDALSRPSRRDPDDPTWLAARAKVMELVRERGWSVEPGSLTIDGAADAIAAIRQLGPDDLLTRLPVYADAAELVAEVEVGAVLAREGSAAMVEALVTGTILGAALLASLHRLAQQDASARHLRAPQTGREAES